MYRQFATKDLNENQKKTNKEFYNINQKRSNSNQIHHLRAQIFQKNKIGKFLLGETKIQHQIVNGNLKNMYANYEINEKLQQNYVQNSIQKKPLASKMPIETTPLILDLVTDDTDKQLKNINIPKSYEKQFSSHLQQKMSISNQLKFQSAQKNPEITNSQEFINNSQNSYIQQRSKSIRVLKSNDNLKTSDKNQKISSQTVYSKGGFLNKDQNKIIKQKEFVISSLNQEFNFKEKELEESLSSIKESNEVYLLKSVYKNRPPTIFFPYPSVCNFTKPMNRAVRLSEQDQEKFDLKFKIPGEQPYKCVMAAFKAAGFKRTKGDGWYCYWGFLSQESHQMMQLHQKINHFPGCWHVGRKDKLWLHLSSAKRRFPVDYNIIPATYLMQYDWEKIKTLFQESKKTETYIMKPVASACGRGIKLVTNKDTIKKNKNYLISEYIQNCHLINNYKYDLRIYVLVTSFDPLKIYIYKEGLCRFATEHYDTKKIKQRYSHLTNYSVNKKNSKNKNAEQDAVGSKWSLTALKQYYEQNNINTQELFEKIYDVIIKTLIAVEPYQQAPSRRGSCFELYGFDVLVDQNLKPWLIEVNVCASLSSSSPMDRRIKYSLISDICNLVGFVPFNQKKNEKIQNDKKIYGNAEKEPIQSGNIIQQLEDINYINCLQKLNTKAWKVLLDFDEEFYRKGNFDRAFPNKSNVDQYQQYFQYPRFNNVLLQKFLNSQENLLLNICEQVSFQHV